MPFDRCTRQTIPHCLRRMLVHEYATATAEEVHESAQIVSGAFPLFYNAYLQWIQHGFKPRTAASKRGL
jgi:hypothetical protein